MARLGHFLFGIFSALSLFGVHAAPADAKISVGDIVNALKLNLVTHINATITLESLTTNLISINFDVKNSLPIELTIDRVVSKAGINGTVFATFDHTFTKPVVVPLLGTANSGTINNVLLTQGALASLDIIPLGFLDLISTDVFVRAFTIFGMLGIPIPVTGIKQSHVPTAYNLALS
ncbi:hypothetical protein HGRIS_008704 [Hohenbuehelia grisea]|uniref:Uncharacterized protein n=1 Tax=Hohenbuehelia grisea TaxID=104357 RepID=A0ABR3J992_9AGAR